MNTRAEWTRCCTRRLACLLLALLVCLLPAYAAGQSTQTDTQAETEQTADETEQSADPEAETAETEGITASTMAADVIVIGIAIAGIAFLTWRRMRE